MLCDIVILPPSHLRQRIGRRVVESAKGLSSKFLVDNQTLIPHLSLFHIRVHTARLVDLSKNIRDAARQHKPIRIVNKKTSGHGMYPLIVTNKPRALVDLHRDMVHSCFGLRNGMMPWTPKRKPTSLEKRNRERYGTQHLLESFAPHFTLAGFTKENQANEFVQRFGLLEQSFMARSIALTEVNRNHQVLRVLKTFRLRG